VDDGALLVRGIPEGTAAVGVHVIVHLEVEERLVVVYVGQLLRQRTGVGGEDAGELLLAGHPQYLVLHEVHAGDVLAGIQILGGAHHERVQDLVEALGQVVVPVEDIKLAQGASNIQGLTHLMGPSQNSRNSKTMSSLDLMSTSGSFLASKFSAVPMMRSVLRS